MTKKEKADFMTLKSMVRSAYTNLKYDAADYDCTWPKSIINRLKECLELMDKFKI
jgi:hypothetical protein